MNIIVNNINKREVKSKNGGNFFLKKVISPFKEIEKAIRKPHLLWSDNGADGALLR